MRLFSGFIYNFVLQNQFLHRKSYTKNQKMKNSFLDPKKTFSYKTYGKNFILLKKFVLQNHFLHIKFYGKNQKTKNEFLDPKGLFYTKHMNRQNIVRI